MTKIITIDGPASSGKGTIAKIIAKKLGYFYLDSGSIYRVLAFMVIQEAIPENSINEIIHLMDTMQLEFLDNNIILKNKNIAQLIREEEVGLLASRIAINARVREKLLNLQRDFAKDPGLVTDGRDMGSVVFPNATLKIFLIASPEVRSSRRLKQLQLLGKPAKIAGILNDIIIRDQLDSEREIAPLSYDKSFKVLDNSDLTIEETVTKILSWFEEELHI